MSRPPMGHNIPEWNTPEVTEGQFLSEWRRTGRDGEFQAHLAQRHLLILWHKLGQLIAEPILRRLTRVLDRG